MKESKSSLKIISGLSGSGKSIALNVLEDAGFNCIDNVPINLLDKFISNLIEDKSIVTSQNAIGIDARAQNADLAQVPKLVEKLKIENIDFDIIFLEADNEILIQRFSETRRRHPLTDENKNLEAAIKMERQLLGSLRDNAHLKIDTSKTSLHELRFIIREQVLNQRENQLSIMLQSFGYKFGIPRNADFVFDVRCLANPHWEKDLRSLTGLDLKVKNFLKLDKRVEEMIIDIKNFLEKWVDCFEKEGKSYLTIAIGCTGGQHRSVYIIENLKKRLGENGWSCMCNHRELKQ